jgi:hypothetical protein
MCPICAKESIGLCQRCELRIHRQLEDIKDFYEAAHAELIPGNGGHGSSSGERTIGVNVAALSFIAGDDILKVLHSWEVIVRAERKLTPPALLDRYPVSQEVALAIGFAQGHLNWMGMQEWIGDFADEVKDLHAIGKTAARDYVEKVKRIQCPADTQEGLECGHWLKINEEELTDIVPCKKCGTEWSAIRLIAVAMTDARRDIWVDAEAIGEYLNIPARYVRRDAKKLGVAKKGQLYNLKEFVALRVKKTA